MVNGGFCQCERLGLQPTVGVRRRDVNLLWRDDQDVQLRNIRKRIDLISLVDSQRSSAVQEKGDVRAQRRGNLQQARRRQFFLGQPQITQQGRGGIARAAAQSAARGNRFFQLDLHAAADFQFAPERVHRSIDKIFLRRLGGKRLV